jgi:hypothetical protein
MANKLAALYHAPRPASRTIKNTSPAQKKLPKEFSFGSHAIPHSMVHDVRDFPGRSASIKR